MRFKTIQKTDGVLTIKQSSLFPRFFKRDMTNIIFDMMENETGKIVGRCDLRLGMNEELYYAGNIGYTVYVPYRGHRYAQRACELIFEVARHYKMQKVIITCSPDNLPSKMTCEHLGLTLLETVEVPLGHYLHRQGEPIKHIYQKIL